MTDRESSWTDVLPVVNLGSFLVSDFMVGIGFTCALSTNYEIKCFGSGSNGKLGYGDRNNRGNEAKEMGDRLPIVDIGSEGWTGSEIHISQSDGESRHLCVFEDSADLLVKC